MDVPWAFWKANNILKSRHVLNQAEPDLPDLPLPPEVTSSALWEALGNLLVIDELAQANVWRLFPPPEIWPHRYIAEWNDTLYEYSRVAHPVADELEYDENDVDGLIDLDNKAFEIIAFMSQANAAPIGTKVVGSFGENIDIKNIGLPNANDAAKRINHGFQFQHDAATTNAFWNRIKTQTDFGNTY